MRKTIFFAWIIISIFLLPGCDDQATQLRNKIAQLEEENRNCKAEIEKLNGRCIELEGKIKWAIENYRVQFPGGNTTGGEMIREVFGK